MESKNSCHRAAVYVPATSTPFHKFVCQLILRFSVSARRRKETMRASSIDDNAAMAEKMSVKMHTNF